MAPLDVAGYLGRLGVCPPPEPSLDGLLALHAAHLERVPYECVEIHLGRPTTVDPEESADRILRRGRGGYCYHLNGAFSALLTALGYAVTGHVAGVQGSADDAPGIYGNHLALTVAGLPTEDNPDGVWWADVGLGDGFHAPLPLRAGTYRQGPFTYGLRPSEVTPGGWRLDHDPTGSFVGCDVPLAPATPDAFVTHHRRLSTSPESAFVLIWVVQRRDATGVDSLRGCVLSRLDASGTTRRELLDEAAWFGAQREIFAMRYDDVPPKARTALFDRVLIAHHQWTAANRPS